MAEAETQTSPAERDCLAKYADSRNRLIEIGVWHGVTTCRLRRAMAPEGVLYAVDPYQIGRLGFSAQQVIAHREVARIRRGDVRWLRMTGVEAARAYTAMNEAPVDFIFIDGDHSYDGLRDDWHSWNPLLKEGGIIALHDSCSSATRQINDAGSVRFTREVIYRDPRFEIAEVIDTLTVLRRRSDG